MSIRSDRLGLRVPRLDRVLARFFHFLANGWLLGLAVLLGATLGIAQQAHGKEILFIGNSFTYGGPAPTIHGSGGVPRLVQDIAVSKGKKIGSRMLAVGGMDWGFHLQSPSTESALQSKNYDWVVLQDYSIKPTRLGNPGEFFQHGQTFYRKIRQFSPKTLIVLYETWARGKGHPYYTGTSSPKTFTDPSEMTAELEKSYVRLENVLETGESGEQVILAPVGTAFARCLKEYPEINLYSSDKYHANLAGSYLAALVIYTAIFQESPKGSATSFEAAIFDPTLAAKLQKVAEEVVLQNAKTLTSR